MTALSVDTSKNVGADVKKGSNMRIYGTSYVPQVTNTLGIFPTRNFQQGTFENTDKIDGVALKEQYLIRHTACYRCPLACGRLTEGLLSLPAGMWASDRSPRRKLQRQRRRS